MDCLAIFNSGNYAFHLCRVLEKKERVFEVVSIPCHIAKDGCGYCLKFPEEYVEEIIAEGISNKTPVKEVYRIIHMPSKNKYERIY